MKQRFPIFVLAVVGLALAIPASGLADDKKSGEPAAGGAAAEQRSDQADENSNAQWSKDATKGQERSAERSHTQPKTADKAKHPVHTGTAKQGTAKQGTAKQSTAKHGTAKPGTGTAMHKDKAGHEDAAKGSAHE